MKEPHQVAQKLRATCASAGIFDEVSSGGCRLPHFPACTWFLPQYFPEAIPCGDGGFSWQLVEQPENTRMLHGHFSVREAMRRTAFPGAVLRVGEPFLGDKLLSMRPSRIGRACGLHRR